MLDLTDVTFMDSTGLRVLLDLRRAAAESGLPLAIVCPEGPARLILEVAGVEDILPLHPTLEEATAALSAAPPVSASGDSLRVSGLTSASRSISAAGSSPPATT